MLVRRRAAGTTLFLNSHLLADQGEFSLRLALPADRLESWFERCGDRGRAP